jgi:predicted nucleic acid-binding protein
MTYLIDTDYVVDYLVGRSQATSLLPALIQQGAAISIITVGEIYEGIYYGRDPRKGEEGFRRFRQSVPTLPLSKDIMKLFAQIRGELRRTGNLVGDLDLLIGATARAHNLTIVTRNLKDYTRIPSLKFYQQAA